MARTDTLPHFLTDVADAIRTKSGTSDPIQASAFDTAISNIPAGGESGWQRPSDWWDTETILANAENKTDSQGNTVYPAYIILMANWDKVTTFSATASNASLRGDGYLTSDGAWYGTSEATHTWDTTKDKPCSEGYKTRYVIVYVKDRTTSVGTLPMSKFKCLEIILGNFTANSFPMFGATSASNANNYIQNIKAMDNNNITTLVSGSYGQFQNCRCLKSISSKKITTVSNQNNIFQYCYALEYVDLPNAILDCRGTNKFYYTYSLKKIIVKGFSNDPASQFLNNTGIDELNFDYELNSLFSINNAYSLKKIDMPNCKGALASQVSQCYGLEKLNLGKITTIGNNLFPNCINLKSFTIPNTVTTITPPAGSVPQFSSTIEFISVFDDFDISGMNLTYDTNLSYGCLIDILSKLKDVTGESETYTLTLGSTNLAKLTADEISVGAAKGWTIN